MEIFIILLIELFSFIYLETAFIYIVNRANCSTQLILNCFEKIGKSSKQIKFNFILIPTPLTSSNYPLEKGALMDIWRNIGGSSLAPLLANPRYPEKPSSSNMVPGLASPAFIGDNYGLRLKTFYVVS